MIRLLDRGIVAVIKFFIAMAHIRSRDPRERMTNLVTPDHRERTRIRNWEAVLAWSPQRRVGCATGVFIGILVGGAILWYGLR